MKDILARNSRTIKRFIALICFAPFFFNQQTTQAQINIDENDFETVVGSTKSTIEGYEIVNFGVLAWGANQHWDYSLLVLTNGAVASQQLTVATGSPFQNTNWVLKNTRQDTSGQTEFREWHGQFSDSALLMTGQKLYNSSPTDTSTWNFGPGYKHYEFPLVYMNSWWQEFTQIHVESGVADTQLIKYVAQVDGWGQVSTPIGTYDCLRLVAARSVYNPLTFQWEAIDNDFTWLADSIGVVFQVEGYHFDNLVGDHVGIVRYYDPTVSTGFEFTQAALTETEITALPNPFSIQTSIRFTLSEQANVSLVILNSSGKLIEKLMNGNLQSGEYEKNWNPGNDLAAGAYSCVLTVDGALMSKRIVLAK